MKYFPRKTILFFSIFFCRLVSQAEITHDKALITAPPANNNISRNITISIKDMQKLQLELLNALENFEEIRNQYSAMLIHQKASWTHWAGESIPTLFGSYTQAESKEQSELKEQLKLAIKRISQAGENYEKYINSIIEQVNQQKATLQSLKAQLQALRKNAENNHALLTKKLKTPVKKTTKIDAQDPLANLKSSLNSTAAQIMLINNQIVNDITQLAENDAETDKPLAKKEADLQIAQSAATLDKSALETLTAFEKITGT